MSTFREALLFLCVAVLGLGLIRLAATRLGDPRLRRLGPVFLLKLALVVVVLRFGWMPMLDTGTAQSGYDPQRFYADARALVDAGFDPAVARAASLNYTGIVWYYGVVMAVLGLGPLSPALVNAFVTLIAVLVLVDAGYRIRPVRGRHDWILGLAMLLPEVVWYDALTSRETLVMSLLTIATLAAGTALLGAPGAAKRLAVAAASLLLLSAVRPPMLVPAVAAIAVLVVAVGPGSRRGRAAAGLGVLAVAALLVSPVIGSFLGSYSLPFPKLVEEVLSGSKGQMETISWGRRSIGQMFVSSSAAGALVCMLPRLVLYLVAPLGSVRIHAAGLVSGNWADWQAALQGASAVLNVTLMPLALAGLAIVLVDRGRRDDLVFHVPCWSILLAIAAGNQIIQERYRVMGMLLLWGCLWLGRTAPRRYLQAAYAAWFGLLALGGVFVIAYKLTP